jgi:hypothetical protein
MATRLTSVLVKPVQFLHAGVGDLEPLVGLSRVRPGRHGDSESLHDSFERADAWPGGILDDIDTAKHFGHEHVGLTTAPAEHPGP